MAVSEDRKKLESSGLLSPGVPWLLPAIGFAVGIVVGGVFGSEGKVDFGLVVIGLPFSVILGFFVRDKPSAIVKGGALFFLLIGVALGLIAPS
ncbi:hypothetical protein [Ornithinimicrobium sp. INDO-MA30-4]|uniref:hypothetical protein n=1 Tax=Ornithinimicrobium sp. INDO-MA30-4 TaxID=2908651 RepID=UPI001F2FFC9C|nr:hypothetical protein [Ornithinimicrobium sp. INDO-MA30-4]UJH70482.1 hypothetical protein L0A91_15530 [Ornithinimicrobium sp. INDO-MA30-4]